MEGPERHFIEDEEVNEKILRLYGLWDVKAQLSSGANGPSVTIYLDASESQILSPASSLHARIPRRIPI